MDRNLQKSEIEFTQDLKRLVQTCLYHICSILYRDITLRGFSVLLPRGRNEMKLITLYLPETYIKLLDQLVVEKFYPNRAEVIRVAIRDLINEEVWRRKNVD